MSQDKDVLINEGKRKGGEKNQQTNTNWWTHHLLQVDRETQPVSKQWLPPKKNPPPSFIAEHDIIQCGPSLWSAGISCPGCVPSQCPVHPQSTHWNDRFGKI